jgi:outer membrane protein assembly factor BamD (BamD/ComL family)
MLGQQDAQFFGGALSEERSAVRVLAWCAAGQPEQARAARDRFFASYPHSPHAKRILNSCAKQ